MTGQGGGPTAARRGPAQYATALGPIASNWRSFSYFAVS